MQIHELNNFAGTPTSSDYLAIDNSTTTTKIGATGLGIQTQMTVAEATTGTSTASRIVTPKVVHDYVTGEVSDGIDNILTSATETKWAGITGGDGSINDIANYLSDIGTILEKTWKISSSSSSGTACTDDITLTPGVWMLGVLTPTCSASVLYSFSGISSTLGYPYFTMGTGQSCWVPVSITSSTNTHIATAGSTSVTFSNTTRGKLFAIRIG